MAEERNRKVLQMELPKEEGPQKVIPKEGLRKELLADGGDHIKVAN